MANSLLNGPGVETPPDNPVKAETVPTWGYAADGRSQIFQLAPDEALPDGWSDAPVAVEPEPEAPAKPRKKAKDADSS